MIGAKMKPISIPNQLTRNDVCEWKQGGIVMQIVAYDEQNTIIMSNNRESINLASEACNSWMATNGLQ